MNKHTPDIEGIVEKIKEVFKETYGSLYLGLHRPLNIDKDIRDILQSQADQYEREKGEMMEKIQERIDYVRPNAHKPEVANEIGALLWCKFLIEKYGVDLSE